MVFECRRLTVIKRNEKVDQYNFAFANKYALIELLLCKDPPFKLIYKDHNLTLSNLDPYEIKANDFQRSYKDYIKTDYK